MKYTLKLTILCPHWRQTYIPNLKTTIMKTFSKYLTDFFTKYLCEEKGVSKHTLRSYGEAFSLLLTYFNDVKKIHADKIALCNITREEISGENVFLAKNHYSYVKWLLTAIRMLILQKSGDVYSCSWQNITIIAYILPTTYTLHIWTKQ